MKVVYGYEMVPQSDLFASIADRMSEMLTNCFFPSTALENTSPIHMYHVRTPSLNIDVSLKRKYDTCPSGALVLGSSNTPRYAGS